MSEVLYIPAKVKHANIVELIKKVKIEGSFAIVTTIQFLDEVNQLKEKGYTVLGQILGCNTQATKNMKEENFLYIGTGKFHPLNLAFSQEKPVYCLDPMTEEFYRITNEEKEQYTKKRKGALLKYIAANKVGITVSLKSGQNQIKRALQLKKKIEGKKQTYLFLCDTVRNLEDFNDIECWVNTACIRIVEDDFSVPMVNIRDVEKLL